MAQHKSGLPSLPSNTACEEPAAKCARSEPQALPKPRPAPLFSRGQLVEGLWEDSWFPGSIESRPVWCFGGWRYELRFQDGGRVTLDSGAMESWSPTTSGQAEESIRLPAKLEQEGAKSPLPTDALGPQPSDSGCKEPIGGLAEISALNREALRKLCRVEGLAVGGSTSELRRRVIVFYHGHAGTKCTETGDDDWEGGRLDSSVEDLSIGPLGDPMEPVDTLLQSLRTMSRTHLESYFDMYQECLRSSQTLECLRSSQTLSPQEAAICKLAIRVIKLEMQRRIWTTPRRNESSE